MSNITDAATTPAAARRPIRWWPAVLVLMAATIVLGAIWAGPLAGLDRQSQVMRTIGASALTLAVLVAWAVTISRLDARIRLAVAVIAALAVGMMAAFYRVQGVTGDLIPVLVRRGSGIVVDSGNALAKVRVDLTKTTPHDFPQFLGPDRRPQLTGVQLDTDWVAHPPKLLWKHPVGSGWSAFAVVGDYAITQEQHAGQEQIVCYELRTGRLVWRYTQPAIFESVIAGTGPRATPTIADGRVYAMGATGLLTCLDGGTGAKLWSRDTLADGGAKNRQWGNPCSPLVVGQHVIVSPGGHENWSLAAYNRDTGDVVWHAGTDYGAYSSPALVTLLGVPQILILNALSVAAHDPANGQVLWERAWGEGNANVAQPLVIGDNQIFISSGYGYGCILIELARDNAGQFTANDVWKRNRNMKFKFTNGVVRDDCVYGLDDGVLACLDLKTGQRRWKRGRYGHGQVLLVDDLLIVQAESGAVYLVRISPEAPQELGQFPALEQKTWNNPVLAGSLLLVRNDQMAACYELPLAGR